MVRHGAVMMAAAALASCSGGESGGNNSSGAAIAQVEPPENLTIDQQNGAVPVTLPSPSAIAAIPAAFQGRWGIGAADCDPAQAAAAKGLVTVAGDGLSVYESRGKATDLRRLGPDQIGFALAMSGEGMTWNEPTRLSLQGDGRTLIRQATGSRDRAGVFTYRRCPA